MTRSVLSFALVFAFAALGSCVRLDEPDYFHCESSADCGDDERCRDDGMCVPMACKVATDCDANQGCRGKRCVPAECGSRIGFCANDFGCDLERKLCYRKCSDTQPCAFGAVCTSAGLCVKRCTSEATCNGHLCSGGICSTSCLSNLDCASDFACNGHHCVRRDDVACSSDGECLSGHCCWPPGPRCSATPCRRLDAGGGCNHQLQCKSLVCDLGKCIGP